MKKIFTLITIIFTVLQSFAQIDAPIVFGGPEKGDVNSTVEILSKNGTKGFMPPRLSAVQIKSFEGNLNSSNKGMTVYNTTENCLQSWKGDSWSECDAISLAKFTFNCNASSIKGNYYTDRSVTVNEYLEVSVIVTKPGTFTFYTETKNGIRFFLSSIFSESSTTPKIIQVPAVGIPLQQGNLTYNLFDQSGKNCCSTDGNFVTNVTENKAAFSISCANTAIQGEFTENQPNTNQGLILQLNVNVPGNYALKTNVIDGMWFEGNGFVGAGSAQKIMLQAFGTPTWNSATNGKLTFLILDKASTDLGCNFDVQLQSTQSAFILDCTTAVTVEGLLVATEPATGQNYIKIKMNVTKVGPWVMETNTINGLKFTASGTFDNVGADEVILYADGIPTTAGDQRYTIINKTNATTICSDVTVNVSPNQALFILGSCTSTAQSGTWKNNTALAGASVTVSITASQAGPYNLTSSDSGVNLSASGTAVAGVNRITFAATGQPTTSGSISFTLEDSKLIDICTISVAIAPSKGSKDNPGIDCLDILTDTPSAADNEYWIKPTGYTGQSIKTFCDMKNGGYTLVWSYSEKTAFNDYETKGRGYINGNYYRMNVNTPINADNYTTEVVNYENFRLPLVAMKGIAPQNQAVYKVRIASGVAGATNMNDANALANYFNMRTPVNGLDVRYNSFSTNSILVDGKILGVPFTQDPKGDTYNGLRNAGYGTVNIDLYHNGGYAFHINFYGGSPLGGNPNYFGWFGEGGQEVNAHFYNCKNGQAKCNGNDSGSGGVTPSPNNRVLQWFIK